MARSSYIYYAQLKRKPADPAYSRAFTVKHELVSWLGDDDQLYQLWRIPDGGSYAHDGRLITTFKLPQRTPDPDAGWKHFRDMCS